MPRVARIVVPGAPHHVTQRGNNRQPVFTSDGDRLDYLSLLNSRSRKHSLEVIAYCLMNNHIHVIAIPARVDTLARAIGMTHLLYARSFNERNERSGHLWQGRFFSCPLDPVRTLEAIRYVELNPVRAGVVGSASRYPWSSAAAHSGTGEAHAVLGMTTWRKLADAIDWSEFISSAEDGGRVTELKASTLVGRPWGSARFIDRVAQKLGRTVRPRPVGRPRLERRE